jgi:hypothetical protein
VAILDLDLTYHVYLAEGTVNAKVNAGQFENNFR